MSAKSGHNEGFRILDDFVCEALPDVALAQPTRSSQGQNERMPIMQDMAADTVAEDVKQAGSAASKERSLVGEFLEGVLVVRSTTNQLHESESKELLEVVHESGAKEVLLNLDGVSNLSGSVFLGTLVSLQRRLLSLGGQLMLCNVSEPLRDIFRICSVHTIFPIYSNQQEALQRH
jgi:stage II sporulation protein AA (anti-sigma F factor antagonist)